MSRRGNRPEGQGAEPTAPVAPEPETNQGAEPTAPVAPEPAAAAPTRAGLVALVAVGTCSAHGMPHLPGDKFSAHEEVAARLVLKGLAKRA